MQIHLIVRPRDRMPWMQDVRDWVTELRSREHDVRPRLTFEGGDAAGMARTAVREDADLIVAIGGDGTVNEVVNGVAGKDWSGELAVVPLGTANDFASGLGIPEEMEAAFDVAENGDSREIDIARVNDRYFVNVSTGGFGAMTTEETPSEAKRLLGTLAYLVTGVQKLNELEPSAARFTTPDGEQYDGDLMLYAVGNGRQTGAGSLLTPRAELDDGELDVMIVPGMTRVDFMSLAPRMRSGAHLDHPDIVYFRTPELTVESEGSLSVNADGEALSGRSFEYDVPGPTLRVRVP